MTTTVEEVRKILGKKYDGLSDEMIERLISLFSNYAKLAISQHIAEKKAKIRAKIKQSSR
jgi:hypothetical protein